MPASERGGVWVCSPPAPHGRKPGDVDLTSVCSLDYYGEGWGKGGMGQGRTLSGFASLFRFAPPPGGDYGWWGRPRMVARATPWKCAARLIVYARTRWKMRRGREERRRDEKTGTGRAEEDHRVATCCARVVSCWAFYVLHFFRLIVSAPYFSGAPFGKSGATSAQTILGVVVVVQLVGIARPSPPVCVHLAVVCVGRIVWWCLAKERLGVHGVRQLMRFSGRGWANGDARVCFPLPTSVLLPLCQYFPCSVCGSMHACFRVGFCFMDVPLHVSLF